MGWSAVKIAVDTNILVRAAVHGDPSQAAAAAKVLPSASLVAVSLPCLCEFVWVLRRVYAFHLEDIADAIEQLLAIQSVIVNRPAVETGLKTLRAGGDFADGILAHEGLWMGGEQFVTFDKKAVTLLSAHGYAARVLK